MDNSELKDTQANESKHTNVRTGIKYLKYIKYKDKETNIDVQGTIDTTR